MNNLKETLEWKEKKVVQQYGSLDDNSFKEEIRNFSKEKPKGLCHLHLHLHLHFFFVFVFVLKRFIVHSSLHT